MWFLVLWEILGLPSISQHSTVIIDDTFLFKFDEGRYRTGT